MSENSRVKKYEDLRKDIVSNPEGDEMSDSAKRRIIEHVTSPTQVVEQVEAQRAKDTSTKSEESEDVFVSAMMRDSIDAEQNEYFDDFIDEVRQYNIDKGTKSDYNTQIDILKQLKDQSEQQRKRYVEDIPEEVSEVDDTDEIYTSTLSSEEIAQQVRSLIFQTEENDVVEEDETTVVKSVNEDLGESTKESRSDRQKKSKASIEDKEITILPEKSKRRKIDKDFEEEDKTLQIQLLEETQQLRKQVENYEGELNDLSKDLSKNNVLINRILLFLIFLLIGCVIFFSYLLLTKVGVL